LRQNSLLPEGASYSLKSDEQPFYVVA